MLQRSSTLFLTIINQGWTNSVAPLFNTARYFGSALSKAAFASDYIPNIRPDLHLTRLTNCAKKRQIKRTIARTMATQDEDVIKRYLEMSLDEKRSQYKCGQKYTTLESVETWIEYAKKTKLPQSKSDVVFPVNTELNSKVSIWRGDITTLEVDAIVNAANNSLLGGGGVDGAIHSAAGKYLLAECKLLNGCDTGQAKITGGYKLPARHVIHTVGPRGEKPDMLQSCYSVCLDLLIENGLRSVAFPCISTGIYGYPSENAAHVALETVRSFLQDNPDKVDRIIFCIFLFEDLDIYHNLMQQYFPIDG